MLFRQLFDSQTSTYTYLIADSTTKIAVLVDPVLEQVERDRLILQELGLTLRYTLETHIHADHITGAAKLRATTGCLIIVPENPKVDGADHYIKDGEILQLRTVTIKAIATPGHTDSHTAYLVNNDRVLTGDALLIRGCGRTDFQSGDAGTLYDTIITRLFTLPDDTFVYPAHDYRGHTMSTIEEEKLYNPRFGRRGRGSFIDLMENLNLAAPQKIKEAVPANENCGRFAEFD